MIVGWAPNSGEQTGLTHTFFLHWLARHEALACVEWQLIFRGHEIIGGSFISLPAVTLSHLASLQLVVRGVE